MPALRLLSAYGGCFLFIGILCITAGASVTDYFVRVFQPQMAAISKIPVENRQNAEGIVDEHVKASVLRRIVRQRAPGNQVPRTPIVHGAIADAFVIIGHEGLELISIAHEPAKAVCEAGFAIGSGHNHKSLGPPFPEEGVVRLMLERARGLQSIGGNFESSDKRPEPKALRAS